MGVSGASGGSGRVKPSSVSGSAEADVPGSPPATPAAPDAPPSAIAFSCAFSERALQIDKFYDFIFER